MSFNAEFKVLKKVDNTIKIVNSLNTLAKKDVAVGIPQAKDVEHGDEVTNAQLMYIHSKGAPINNLPARPTIEPAVEQNKERIGELSGQAIGQALRQQDYSKTLERTGLFIQNKAKEKFGSDELTPLKEATKKRKAQNIVRGKKGKKVAELREEFIAGNGNPLIDTGQLRDSITYVVRDK